MTADMLAGMPTDPAPGTVDPLGVIGARQLIAVQTFDVARLLTYPVPLVPGTFIAVSGEGPKGDSNGSGKTSFLAVVSLLHAETQWRLDSDGGRNAARLLFRPDAAGVPAEANYEAAKYGYLVGVFAAPAQPDLNDEQIREHLDRTAVTVWIRLSATPKYIRVRFTHGLHVAEAESDVERYATADLLWDALPAGEELGSQQMGRVLFGETPRCMAYLDTTLRKSVPSLLSQQMNEMTPELIGESLIALTGRETLLEDEQEQRRILADQQIGLVANERADRDRRIEEESELTGVIGRREARTLLEDGEHLWRCHDARGYLDALAAAAALEAEVEAATAVVTGARDLRDGLRRDLDTVTAATGLAEAEAAARTALSAVNDRLTEHTTKAAVNNANLAGLATRRNTLLASAAAWTGTPIEQLQTRAGTASDTLEHAVADLITADRLVAGAEADLAAARSGGGGPGGAALAVLTEAGIDARLFLDDVTLDAGARTGWEPRLFPHRHAVVVAPADETAALAALAAMPGASLILADASLGTAPAPALPPGVSTSLPVTRFLTALSSRTRHDPDPHRVTDTDLGEATLGGFDREIAGRAARIKAAHAALVTATGSQTEARTAERTARLVLADISYDLDASRAAHTITEIETEQAAILDVLLGLETVIATLTEQAAAAEHTYLGHAAAKRSHDTEVRLAQTRFEHADTDLARVAAVQATKVDERRRAPVEFWATAWADTPLAAQAFLDAQPDRMGGLLQGTFRSRASDALKDALAAYQLGVGDLPPSLAEVVERRRQLVERESGVAGATVSFTSIAQPLRDLLDSARDRDQVTEDKILRDRLRRSDELDATRTEVGRLEQDMAITQQMVVSSLRTALGNISAALDRLDRSRGGFGAELQIEHEPPNSPAVPWKWKVRPHWRRAPGAAMVPYEEMANGAQIKVFAIQLVLAAMLAAEGAGRILVLDELGNSLGDTNRRDVLNHLNEVARELNLTILGTCQDSVINDAAAQCGEILWFEHTTETDTFNQPTRAWGHDQNGDRVLLVADWLRAGRTIA